MTGNKFMAELHLKQLGFSDGTCGTFTKSNERVKKLKKLVTVKTYIEMHQTKYVFFRYFFRNIKEKSQKRHAQITF